MEEKAMSKVEKEPWEILGYRRDGTPIYPIAGGAPDPDADDGDGDDGDDIEAKNRTPQRVNSGNIYRNLQEIERRQVAIRSELSKLDSLDDPSDEDLDWQGTLIEEYDDLETRANPLRKRHADLKRVQEAAVKQDNVEKPDQANRNRGPDFVPGAKREDPFRDLDSVRMKIIPRKELHDRARYAIEQDHKRGDFPQEHADVAMARVEANFGTNLGANLSSHVLLTGSKEYRDTFDAY